MLVLFTNNLLRVSAFMALTACLPLAAQAASLETKAQQAIVVDAQTGQVLLSKEAQAQMHPSSMSKLMTLYVLFSKLKEGKIKMDDTLAVSEKAWRMQGSKMFVHVGDQVPVENLIRGIAIQSGNDACIVVAEGISGSEDAFAQLLNQTGKEIGLRNSHFVNATGWPDEGHLMTAEDLEILTARLIADFPEYYHYFSERDFVYNNIHQPNRNRLLGSDLGVDGLKTGHTEVAGYGIVLSAKDPKTGRRVNAVINGLTSDNERVQEGDKLLRWAFREFENKTVAKVGDTLLEAPVWFGDRETVPLTVEQDVLATLPVNGSKEITLKVVYDSPLPAPITKGAHVADLVIGAPGQPDRTAPLIAATDVAKLSGFRKLVATLKYYLSSGK